MAIVSLTLGKFIAGIVIAILASSVISVAVSTILIAGPQGPAGPAGATGLTGTTGPAGAIGPKGDTGDTGTQGPQGATGDAGLQGPQGESGIGFEPTDYISIPPAAFVTITDGAYYGNGGYLRNDGSGYDRFLFVRSTSR